MCESCGPQEPSTIDPELMGRFRESLEARRAGSDAIADPDCYGTPRQTFVEGFKRLLFNVGMALGLA